MLSYAEFVLETMDTISLAEDIEGNQSVSVIVDNKFYIEEVEEYHTIKDEMLADYNDIYWYLLYKQYVIEYVNNLYHNQPHIVDKEFKKFLKKFKKFIYIEGPTIRIKTDKGVISTPWLSNPELEVTRMLYDDKNWIWFNLFSKYRKLNVTRET